MAAIAYRSVLSLWLRDKYASMACVSASKLENVVTPFGNPSIRFASSAAIKGNQFWIGNRGFAMCLRIRHYGRNRNFGPSACSRGDSIQWCDWRKQTKVALIFEDWFVVYGTHCDQFASIQYRSTTDCKHGLTAVIFVQRNPLFNLLYGRVG